jgi:CubicO group peptidase (beta-lactamase class C family)
MIRNTRWIATRGALLALALLGGVTHGSPARAEPLPTEQPGKAGLSAERLNRIGEWLRSEVAKGTIPGAVATVVRGGRVVYQTEVGKLGPSSSADLKADSIFRIYSMTKPIVSVGAMMLVEEGRLLLEAPVSRYIPSFKDQKVGVEKTEADGRKVLDLVPARRPATVQDLLRHTAGLTYGFFGDSLVRRAYKEANISSSGAVTNEDFADRIARMPLEHQPGTTWEYSHATDVLGRVIEVVSGQSLGQFLKTRLLDPLGMADTSFYVPEPERQARLAEPLPNDRMIGNVPMFDPRQVAAMESGGGGLVSTLVDYGRFLLMMRNGGELEGRRYISPATVKYMTSNHLSPNVARTALYVPGDGYGFGLGVAVRSGDGEARYLGAAGDYFWGGAGGTSIWVDPANDLFAILMMQSPREMSPFRSIFRNMVYGAFEPAPAGGK